MAKVKRAPRAKVRQTPTATVKEWAYGDYLVQEINSHYGLPTYSLVVLPLVEGGQRIVSRHRLTTAAKTAAAKLSK